MTTALVFAAGAIIAGLAVALFVRRSPATDDELSSELHRAKERIVELETKGKEQFAFAAKVEARAESLQKENDTLNKKITTHEAHEMQRQKEHSKALADLAAMKDSFEEEKLRIRREDEQRLTEEEEARDRLWAEHEQTVVSLMSDLCKKYQFTSYSNTNLPKGFHGSLKPDFMVEFLEQYIIFDAKVSKAKSLQTYISSTVQKTAEKIKGKDDIYPTVFLVVPTEAISELKETSYYEQGFTFHVISPEAISPILASFKKIESYEFAEGWDPQERENVIDLIAHFHAHISTRNSFDYLVMEQGLRTLERTKTLDQEVLAEALAKTAKIRNLNLNTAEQKQLAAEPELLEKKLSELVSPSAQMDQKELDETKKRVSQS